MPKLIDNIRQALTRVEAPTADVAQDDPAVPIKNSVKKDHIICLECGRKMKMLKRHLRSEHDLSVEDYRSRWGLPADYPIITQEYAARRSNLAKKIGLGKNSAPKSKKRVAPKPFRRKKAAGAVRAS